MRFASWVVLGALVFSCVTQVQKGLAQDKSRIPPIETYKAMLAANKNTGWVQFRNFGGKQLVYFSALQTMHCRLKEIRYSINSQALDKQFPLVACNPQLPFSLPPNSGVEDIALTLPKGTAKIVVVQIVWDDETKSEVVVYEPCKDVGEQTCAWPSNLNRVVEIQSPNRAGAK